MHRLKTEGKLLDYIPNTPVKSEIITYEQFAMLWMMLDDVKRLRVPTIQFRATRDGYNLQGIYHSCD